MSDNTQQGGPGVGRGLPAPHSVDDPFVEARDELRRLTRPGPEKPGPEIVVRGVLRRAEIESNPVVLDAENGVTYELEFSRSAGLRWSLGDTAEVHGEVMKNAATTAQIGPVLRVRSLASLGPSPKDVADEPPAEV